MKTVIFNSKPYVSFHQENKFTEAPGTHVGPAGGFCVLPSISHWKEKGVGLSGLGQRGYWARGRGPASRSPLQLALRSTCASLQRKEGGPSGPWACASPEGAVSGAAIEVQEPGHGG